MKPRTKTKDCRCPRCKCGRRIERIVRGLSTSDGDFLRGLFEALLELSAEAEMRVAAGKN